MHIGVCEYCGKEKEYKYKSWIKKYCTNMASAKTRTKERVKLKCEYCKGDFYLLESVIKSREEQSGVPIKYCSQRCMGLAKRTRYIEKCKNCEKEFEENTYEDSGLSPQEVRELAKAKAEGRLVVLPCKPETKVYRVWKVDGREPVIDEYYAGLRFMVDNLDNFGKTVFLTREEAEKALEGSDSIYAEKHKTEVEDDERFG